MRDEGANSKRSLRRSAVFGALRMIPGPLYRRLKGITALRRVLDVAIPGQGFAAVRIEGGPLEDMVMDLDPRTNKDMVIGRYEPDVVALIQRLVPEGGVAFDLGAHLGYETLVMARRAGRGGRVVSFEPDPVLAERLRINVARNRSSVGAELIPVQAAVGAENGRAFFARGATTGTGRLTADTGEIEVEAVTLDVAAELYGTPDFVKVDVEGLELDVLAGGKRLLDEHETSLLIEAHSPELTRSCNETLEGLGYTCELVAAAEGGGSHIVATPGSE